MMKVQPDPIMSYQLPFLMYCSWIMKASESLLCAYFVPICLPTACLLPCTVKRPINPGDINNHIGFSAAYLIASWLCGGNFRRDIRPWSLGRRILQGRRAFSQELWLFWVFGLVSPFCTCHNCLPDNCIRSFSSFTMTCVGFCA